MKTYRVTWTDGTVLDVSAKDRKAAIKAAIARDAADPHLRGRKRNPQAPVHSVAVREPDAGPDHLSNLMRF